MHRPDAGVIIFMWQNMGTNSQKTAAHKLSPELYVQGVFLYLLLIRFYHPGSREQVTDSTYEVKVSSPGPNKRPSTCTELGGNVFSLLLIMFLFFYDWVFNFGHAGQAVQFPLMWKIRSLMHSYHLWGGAYTVATFLHVGRTSCFH